jgi:para-nitrobenzyl esterase
MTRLISLFGGIALAASATVALAQTAPADSGATPSSAAPAASSAPAVDSSATPAAPYSTSTTQLGILFADPAAKAVIAKYLPDLVNKPDIMDRASGMTLQEVRQAVAGYAPNMFSDKMMADIDADLAKLPVKN